jgi:hypothetical protein
MERNGTTLPFLPFTFSTKTRNLAGRLKRRVAEKAVMIHFKMSFLTEGKKDILGLLLSEGIGTSYMNDSHFYRS